MLTPGLSSSFLEQAEEQKRVVRKKYNLPEKFVLFLGTIEPRKNIVALTEAFALSRSKKNGYELVIAGASGWKYQCSLDAIEKTDGVRSIGYVASEDKNTLYQMADLFVYPSLYEGFGLPVLESMACGTPVITSDRSSLPEVVGRAALLVNPHDTRDIADTIDMVLLDRALYRELSQRGKVRASAFSWQKAVRQWLVFVQS